MARYNEILHLIQHQADDYEPLFWERPDGGLLAGDWAEDFMAGVALRRSFWQPLLESEEDAGLLVPIVAFLHDEEGNSLIEGEADRLAEVQRIAIDLVAPSVHPINTIGGLIGLRHDEHRRLAETSPARVDRVASTSAVVEPIRRPVPAALPGP